MLNDLSNYLTQHAFGPLVALAFCGALVWGGYWIAGRIMRSSNRKVTSAFVAETRVPVLIIVEALVLSESAATLATSASALSILSELSALLVIAASAWLILKTLDVLSVLIAERYNVDVSDNLHARKIQTQFRAMRTVAVVVVVIIAVAAMLMTFDRVRQLGVGIMASAGIVGIVVGMAAQPLLGNILASLQIALTEPIRIDDVVIVEGEWGRIEEITLTYVVVRIWDLRRLVLPISYFTQHPFQNWTRVSADLLGTVYLYVDYTVPIDNLRSELRAALADAPQWDQKVWGLQVTNASEHSVEIRALMSAANSSDAWDLRCGIRERLLGYVKRNYPGALPRARVTLEPDSQ